ncbi:Retrovirus-related Pol polyprotein from transposon TNT 1-94 [Eumeta japonica]|uniref:Retrovirus-related Pol polyprotein from transposon TNT 1-94 n=1 Tax=Eumeta variegata TaxID=151549 RepID=A0A4C1W5L2_EUMVA|nr:Retrovirus-related Pol polyprotein from transposon TNT 1-94 [Eumeta japonica]
MSILFYFFQNGINRNLALADRNSSTRARNLGIEVVVAEKNILEYLHGNVILIALEQLGVGTAPQDAARHQLNDIIAAAGKQWRDIAKSRAEWQTLEEACTQEENLHTDNGREYVNKVFKEYLDKEGIVHELTAPYTPEQNGRAEREIRTIVESARSMLYARDLPLDLWAEAVNYQLRTKLEKKSEKMLLIGYDNTNYRMYDMNKKTIKISRNVIFDEHQVPEVRKNITQICTIDDNEETIQNNETEVRNMDETLIKTTVSESDDSLSSCNNDDPTYEPSQEIEDIMSHRNITLRPRNNRRFEANLVELSLPQTYDEALQSPQI